VFGQSNLLTCTKTEQTKTELYKLINSSVECKWPPHFTRLSLTEFRLNFCLGIFCSTIFFFNCTAVSPLAQQSENCCRNFCVLHKYFSNIFWGPPWYFFFFFFYCCIATIVVSHMQPAISDILPNLLKSHRPRRSYRCTSRHLLSLQIFKQIAYWLSCWWNRSETSYGNKGI